MSAAVSPSNLLSAFVTEQRHGWAGKISNVLEFHVDWKKFRSTPLLHQRIKLFDELILFLHEARTTVVSTKLGKSQMKKS